MQSSNLAILTIFIVLYDVLNAKSLFLLQNFRLETAPSGTLRICLMQLSRGGKSNNLLLLVIKCRQKPEEAHFHTRRNIVPFET